jgi:hypothetical protein
MRIWWVGGLHPNTPTREAGAVVRLVIEQDARVSGLLGAKLRIRAVIPLPTHPQGMIGYRVPSQPPLRIEAVRLGSRRHHNDFCPRPAQPSQRPDRPWTWLHAPYVPGVKGAFG